MFFWSFLHIHGHERVLPFSGTSELMAVLPFQYVHVIIARKVQRETVWVWSCRNVRKNDGFIIYISFWGRIVKTKDTCSSTVGRIVWHRVTQFNLRMVPLDSIGTTCQDVPGRCAWDGPCWRLQRLQHGCRCRSVSCGCIGCRSSFIGGQETCRNMQDIPRPKFGVIRFLLRLLLFLLLLLLFLEPDASRDQGKPCMASSSVTRFKRTPMPTWSSWTMWVAWNLSFLGRLSEDYGTPFRHHWAKPQQKKGSTHPKRNGELVKVQMNSASRYAILNKMLFLTNCTNNFAVFLSYSLPLSFLSFSLLSVFALCL